MTSNLPPIEAYEYRTVSHHIQSAFDQHLNMQTEQGWEPHLFAVGAGVLGRSDSREYACLLRRKKEIKA